MNFEQYRILSKWAELLLEPGCQLERTTSATAHAHSQDIIYLMR